MTSCDAGLATVAATGMPRRMRAPTIGDTGRFEGVGHRPSMKNNRARTRMPPLKKKAGRGAVPEIHVGNCQGRRPAFGRDAR